MTKIIQHKRTGRAIAVDELGVDLVQGQTEMEAILNLERRERNRRKKTYEPFAKSENK